jgi:hypothetical protein
MTGLEYVAGFFDGEGSIGLYCSKSSGRYALRASINQVLHPDSESLFSDLKTTWGGTVSRIKKQNEHHRQAIVWQVYGDRAAKFLEDIRLHLRLKRGQVDLVVPWQREFGSSRAHAKDPNRTALRASKAQQVMDQISRLTSKGPRRKRLDT